MEEINSTVTPQFDGELSFKNTRKKVFRIDEDNNRFIQLNTSDLGAVTRLRDIYPKLSETVGKYADLKVSELDDENSIAEEDMNKIADAIQDMDSEVRGIIDYIFDSNVSSVCAPEGTMFDMFNGQFRFEIIMEEIFKLYESNLSLEYRKMKARIDSKAKKYTGR